MPESLPNGGGGQQQLAQTEKRHRVHPVPEVQEGVPGGGAEIKAFQLASTIHSPVSFANMRFGRPLGLPGNIKTNQISSKMHMVRNTTDGQCLVTLIIDDGCHVLI